MTRISASDARKSFADTISRVAFGDERLIIERNGKDVVAIISVKDLALLHAIEDKIDIDEADAALKEAKEAGFVDWDEAKEGLGI